MTKNEHDKCKHECKRPVTYHSCEEDYIWSPSTCTCECGKDSGMGEYL